MDDDDTRHIHWSEQLENLIAAEAERSRGLSWLHMKSEQKFSFLNNIITIPVIVLSTLSGTASVGSSSLFPDNQRIGSIVIGAVSLCVGILNTIQSYFSYSRRAEAHRIAHLSYSKLFTNISVELSLPREERLTPDKILEELRNSMERLAETTPTPPQDVLDLFNRRFKDEDKTIARPVETNGLYKIAIYRQPPIKNIVLEVDEISGSNPYYKGGSPDGRVRHKSSTNQGSLPREEGTPKEGERGQGVYPP